jgi:hypothetical protein
MASPEKLVSPNFAPRSPRFRTNMLARAYRWTEGRLVGIADGRQTIPGAFMRLAGRQQGVADMLKPIFETLSGDGPALPAQELTRAPGVIPDREYIAGIRWDTP